MANIQNVKVISVKHWSNNLFSFKTERPKEFRFENGHFCMIGVNSNNPIMRAYSIVSTNYDDYLEFFSIKVNNGLLTSQLQKIKPGDFIRINMKSTGSLIVDHLKEGKNLYLISTGTGLAPFLSIIRDPFIYDKFENIVLTHTVREKADLAYYDHINKELINDEIMGNIIKEKLTYFPTVTREDFINVGRITNYIKDDSLSKIINENKITPEKDKFMVCGGPSMLKDVTSTLEQKGFAESRGGYKGDYVIERAFVEK